MGDSMRDRLAQIHLRNVKAELKESESPVQQLKLDAGEVLDSARERIRMEPKQMAEEMDISHSLVLRGLKGVDHLSFHRLWVLSDDFWRELLVVIAKKRRVARVNISLDFSEHEEKAS